MKLGTQYSNEYFVECHDKDGNLRWTRSFFNLVVDEGLTHALESYFNGSGYTGTFFVGLTGNTPVFAPTDTMASHVGWTEVTTYDNERSSYNTDAAANASISNATNKAIFSINNNSTNIGGAFVTTDGTKGGAVGTLYGGGGFTQGNSVANDGDTVSVTITVNSTSS